MRPRLALVALVAMFAGLLLTLTPMQRTHAAPRPTTSVVLAQQGGGQGGGGQGGGGGAAEEGPPWTYQMARIALVMLAFTVLGVGAAYWKFVYTRKKSGV